jgi:hypothetical protein
MAHSVDDRADEFGADPFAPPPEWAQDDAKLSDATRARLAHEERAAAYRRVQAWRHTAVALWEAWAAQVGAVAGAVLLLVGLPFGIWRLFIRTSPHEVTVLEREWSRTIEEEEYQAVSRSRWRSAPAEGWNDDETHVIEGSTSRTYEYYDSWCMSTDKNGFCTLWIDEYEWKYHWTEHRWSRNGRSHTTTDTTSEPQFTDPVWPAPDLGPDGPELGNRRLSGSRRWEILEIVMAGPDGVFTWVAPAGGNSVWHRTKVGEIVIAHVNGVGHVRSITLPTDEVA